MRHTLMAEKSSLSLQDQLFNFDSLTLYEDDSLFTFKTGKVSPYDPSPAEYFTPMSVITI